MAQPVGFDPLSTAIAVGRYLGLSLGDQPTLSKRQREQFEAAGGTIGTPPGVTYPKGAQPQVPLLDGKQISVERAAKIAAAWAAAQPAPSPSPGPRRRPRRRTPTPR